MDFTVGMGFLVWWALIGLIFVLFSRSLGAGCCADLFGMLGTVIVVVGIPIPLLLWIRMRQISVQKGA